MYSEKIVLFLFPGNWEDYQVFGEGGCPPWGWTRRGGKWRLHPFQCKFSLIPHDLKFFCDFTQCNFDHIETFTAFAVNFYFPQFWSFDCRCRQTTQPYWTLDQMWTIRQVTLLTTGENYRPIQPARRLLALLLSEDFTQRDNMKVFPRDMSLLGHF